MIHDFLDRTAATPRFREALAEFVSSGTPNERIRFDYRSPPVKVERVLTQLVASEPSLALDAVEVDGRSGCEFFRGQLVVTLAGGESRRIRFQWDCRWRAMEQGWTDYFGFPDQMRAAREFGYDCFRVWEEVGADEVATA